MTDFVPRFTLTFRPRTPEMVVVGVFTVLGAAFATFVANVVRWVECCSESGLEASGEAEMQFAIALLGIVPAIGVLSESFRARGRPWLWFVATGLVYVMWAVFVAALAR